MLISELNLNWYTISIDGDLKTSKDRSLLLVNLNYLYSSVEEPYPYFYTLSEGSLF